MSDGPPVIHPQLRDLLVPVDTLSPHPNNPNIGDESAIEESIATNGYYNPVIYQVSTGRIIAGEHRWKAMRAAGATHIPAIGLDIDDEATLRVMLVDNRTARLGHDDLPSLLRVLDTLATTGAGLAGTAYTMADLDALIALSMPTTDPEGDDDEATNAAMAKAAWPNIAIPPGLLAALREVPGEDDTSRLRTAIAAYHDCAEPTG